MSDRHLFVINPAAGKKDCSSEIRRALNGAFGETDISYDVYITKEPGDGVKFIREYMAKNSGDFVRVYACGGDGTLNEAVNGVFPSMNGAVGSVPTGSGNDFIKTISDRTKESFLSFRKMVNGSIRTIDTLLVNGRVSLNIISTGFDAATAKGMQRIKRFPLISGSAAYNLSLIKCLFTSRKNHYSYEVDDKPLEGGEGDYLFSIVANGRWYGGGFKAAPDAELSDGKIDFVRINTVSIPKFIGLVGIFRNGEHLQKLSSIAKLIRCEKVKIITGKPVDVNIDGDIEECTDPVITIAKSSLNIIVPEED